MKKTLLLIILTTSLAIFVSAAEMPRVSYTPLSNAARKSGQLKLYDKVPVHMRSISFDGYVLNVSAPRSARAYDVIPIQYTLTQPEGARRAAVEAVGFENAKKAKGRTLFDMAIPGKMGIKMEYLGSVCADFNNGAYIPLTSDPKTPISPFPPYKCDPFVKSSTIRAAEGVWFKFRITNTGDTIIDPEGFGATFTCPWIKKIGKDDKEEWNAQTENLYYRQLNYIYPGESVDQWVHYFCPILGDHNRGLIEGSYRIGLTFLYKYHREFNWGINIWHGKDYAYIEVPIQVTKTGGITPIASTFKILDNDEKMPGYLDSFEEFMTAFDIHQPVEKQTTRKGIVYLQVAPWTKNTVVKLILTDPKQIIAVKIPIHITDETLKVKYNPRNVMVVNQNGKEEPAIMAMAMPGMRSGFQLGPYPEKHMRAEIQEMKQLGVNLISNTAGGWWISELTGRKGIELHSASYKYWYDVLMREAGMKCVGWSLYPPTGSAWYDNAAPLLGKKLEYSISKNVYGSGEGVDVGDPVVPKVIAAWTKYNYGRWGDYWFKTKDGRVPIEIEDTWGWMRDDINIRYVTGPLALQRFQEWVKDKYGTIEKVNASWNSNYSSFTDINPEENQGVEGDGNNTGPVFNRKDNPFHDWTPATEDWDVFRTKLRMDIYRKANEILRKTIPGAELALRTEGANLVIKSDPKSPDMHMRHVYYSQRRNAMVFDVIKKENVLHFHNDYPALPYTEAEWRSAMREMVNAGVIPMYLPQFCRMRDILLQPYYGREYQMHYNLDEPSKGMMIQSLSAAYPLWKATYEEGGAPGIIWSDFLCDAFATETQKRELKLLRKYFNKMKK